MLYYAIIKIWGKLGLSSILQPIQRTGTYPVRRLTNKLCLDIILPGI